MDKDKQLVRPLGSAPPPSTANDHAQAPRGRSERPRDAVFGSDLPRKQETDELYDLLPELRPPKLSPEAIAAAMKAMEIDPVEMDSGRGKGLGSETVTTDACPTCGHHNRRGNKFCAMCGAAIGDKTAQNKAVTPESLPSGVLNANVIASSSVAELTETTNGAHHYHHHYHHHFFPGGPDAGSGRPAGSVSRDPDKLRGSPVLKGEMSRGEAAVRRVTQEWVLACNTKHLDDLLDLYAADALVLRSNIPNVRGASAIREFFFNALDSGLGEVEIEPLRVEVVGGIAYEAGRCKALVSGGAAGKRREERGKYLWVLAKQDDGDWKLAADCWSSDLTLPVETEISPVAGPKPVPPRK
ncbi:MAG TPA: DUF4440 domain-containing protein [Candidatus Sulfotelmatobacter sp.]